MRTITKEIKYNFVYVLVLVFALFARNRFTTSEHYIDNVPVNYNYLVFLVLAIFLFIRSKPNLARPFVLFSCLLIYCIVVVLKKSNNLEQSFHALALFVIPILFAIFPLRENKDQFYSILSLFSFFSLMYSILSIFATVANIFVMGLAGLVGSSGYHRASTPLGSCLSVAYYLNMTLPITLLLIKKTDEKIYKITLLLNIMATLMTLSRSSFITLILICIFLFGFYKDSKLKKWLLGFFCLLLVVLFLSVTFFQLDLSRLTDSVFSTDNSSNSHRFASMYNAFQLFKENILLGTGMGSYFYRLWEPSMRLLWVNNVLGTIDPHSGILLLISELGILGLIPYFFLHTFFVKKMRNTNDHDAEIFGLFMFGIICFNQLAGSQLVNNTRYACIAYVYIGVFCGYGAYSSLYDRYPTRLAN